jgi:hypothetical protein
MEASIVKQYSMVECNLTECVDADSSESVYVNPDTEEKRILLRNLLSGTA